MHNINYFLLLFFTTVNAIHGMDSLLTHPIRKEPSTCSHSRKPSNLFNLSNPEAPYDVRLERQNNSSTTSHSVKKSSKKRKLIPEETAAILIKLSQQNKKKIATEKNI
ncbi:MAG: hypothetical protein WCD44_01835 [Candidatus Babeliales bacterium]